MDPKDPLSCGMITVTELFDCLRIVAYGEFRDDDITEFDGNVFEVAELHEKAVQWSCKLVIRVNWSGRLLRLAYELYSIWVYRYCRGRNFR